MGKEAVRAVFDAFFREAEVSAAGVSQGVKGTVAEKTVEIVRVFRFMTGKIFTGLMIRLKEYSFPSQYGLSLIVFLHPVS